MKTIFLWMACLIIALINIAHAVPVAPNETGYTAEVLSVTADKQNNNDVLKIKLKIISLTAQPDVKPPQEEMEAVLYLKSFKPADIPELKADDIVNVVISRWGDERGQSYHIMGLKLIGNKYRMLIKQLGDKDFEKRQQAQNELVKFGKSIEPILKEYINDPDTEIKSRVNAILEEFKWQGWGPENKGLRCLVASDKTSYTMDEPVNITCKIANLLNKPQNLNANSLHIMGLNTKAFVRFSLNDKNGKEFQFKGEGYEDNKTHVLEIAALETKAIFTTELKKWFDITAAGEYTFKAEFMLDYTNVQVASNPLAIILAEKKAIDEEGINKLIKQLGDNEWEIREKATRELIVVCGQIGESSIAILKSLLEKADDPEVKMRLKLVLSELNGCFGNLLANPSFEDELKGWKIVDNWNNSKIKLVKAEKGEAPDGDYYIEMWHDPAMGDKAWSSSWSSCGQEIRSKLKPDTFYEIKFSYKTGHNFGFRVTISDEAMVMHSTDIIAIGKLLPDGKWHEVTGTVKFTKEQLEYEPFFTFIYDYSTPGTIWFDKLSFKKALVPVEEKK
ncbi:MAG: carbohydrate binding domain-containing protein [Planctomycetes bacterium]|nr:carbohydrate binding domain-containing protein [Planctomycetota bacterium]